MPNELWQRQGIFRFGEVLTRRITGNSAFSSQDSKEDTKQGMVYICFCLKPIIPKFCLYCAQTTKLKFFQLLEKNVV